MNIDEKYTNLFFKWNTKISVLMALLFLLVNCILQYYFFGAFTNPASNPDENSYIYFLEAIHEFNLYNFSGLNSQPFSFLCYLFNQLFDNVKLSMRLVNLIASIVCLGFLYFYYKKNKFFDFSNNKLLNKLITFTIFFAVLGIFEQQFTGIPDGFSVAFGLPGFILLTENSLNGKKHNALLIGFLFAISFTSRPTFIIVLLSFLGALTLFFPKKIFSKCLILVGVYFVLFTAIINFKPLISKGEINLDVKEIPSEYGTSWFEMNYLMAKKWDAAEIPNTQWLSHIDVINYKKENPSVVFPKNHLDILLNDTGLYFRQMIRMTALAMYSSFRYLYFLFPFLLFYYFINYKKKDALETKKVYFVVCFYFFAIVLFSATAFKMLEFRWMQIPTLFFAFYAIHFSKVLSINKRILLYNLVFLTGIGFFILKILK